MNFLLDIGNSRIKWAMSRHDELEVGGTLNIDAIDQDLVLDEVWQSQKPRRVLASNVAGNTIGDIVEGWVRRNWNVSVEFLSAQPSAYGITNGYIKPDQLGVDRWVCLIALPTVCVLPACVIDCGTAITLDLVDATGRHRGGMIMPGRNLMRNGLVTRAPGITESSYDSANASWLGRNTNAAIQGGTLLAAAGMVDKSIRRLQREFGNELSVIITGGDASQIAAESDFAPQLIPDLVLRGLAFIGERDGTGNTQPKTSL